MNSVSINAYSSAAIALTQRLNPPKAGKFSQSRPREKRAVVGSLQWA